MTGWRPIATLICASLGGSAMAQEAQPLPPRIDGEIAETDAADAQGRRFDEYAVDIGPNTVVVVNASPTPGSRLEPVIEVYAGDAARPLVSDGADPGSRTARLSFTAAEAGLFRIRVLGGTGAAGRYTLALWPSRNTSRPLSPSSSPDPHGGVPSVGGGLRARFIICPGHPRCAR